MAWDSRGLIEPSWILGWDRFAQSECLRVPLIAVKCWTEHFRSSKIFFKMSTGQQAVSRTSSVWEFCQYSPLTKLRASLNEGKCDLGSCSVCHCQNFVWLPKGDRVWQIFPLLSLQNATSATTESLWPWSSFALARCLWVDWNHERFSQQSPFPLSLGISVQDLMSC